MQLTTEQLNKLSDLFIDLAKGLFLASLAAPAISSQITFLISLKGIIAGLGFTYLSLQCLTIKKEV